MAMENKENRPKQLSCMHRGPGPAYRLPTLVGYEGHDPSRYRNPAYTLRVRPGGKQYETPGPGPLYHVGKLTKHGPDNPPAYTLAGRDKFKAIGTGPGPGAYHPETCPPMNHSLRPPAYSIKKRSTEKLTGDGPGPNVYMVPSCLGPRVPDKTAQGAFTIVGRHDEKERAVGPGPAAYAGKNYDLVKKRYPAYSIKSRQKLFGAPIGPGPVYYPRFNTRKNQPMYSFGIRHSECAPPAVIDLDNEE